MVVVVIMVGLVALVLWSVVHRIEKRRYDREREKVSDEERRKVQEEAYRSQYE